MSTKLKTFIKQLLNSPKEFPVELAMGIAFFIIAFIDTTFDSDFTIGLNTDILSLFVPLVTLTFFTGKVNRHLYYISGFLFLPLMLFDLDDFIWTYAFGFTYVLAGILLIMGTHRMDNRNFASHVIHVITQSFFGVLIAGLLNITVLAIIASIYYIFGLDDDLKLFENTTYFIWFVIAPQICFTLISQNEYDECDPGKVMKLILNYILSPAVIIYTFILYIYFIKITIEWNLPKGGVAWLVMAFITAALFGKLMQYVLKSRHYDWFYNRFTWIAVPPLIMFWIGSIYRIRLYSLTESRFYLLVAGILMTLFVFMLLRKRTRNFQLMAVIFGIAIVVFTYIPGISAKSIGLMCQKARLEKFITTLNLIDKKTGKLKEYIDVNEIKRDSTLCKQYRDVCSVIDYVRDEMAAGEFYEQYGNWDLRAYEFDDTNDEDMLPRDYELKSPVPLGEYNILLPEKNYECIFIDGRVIVNDRAENLVLEYPIDSVIGKNPNIVKHPYQPFVYKNDSLMLLLHSIAVKDDTVKNVNTYDFQIYKKQ